MIISLSGPIGSGKDTVGKIIQYLVAKDCNFDFDNQPFEIAVTKAWNFNTVSNWQIKKFADKLKEIASILTGIPKADFEKEEIKKKLKMQLQTY